MANTREIQSRIKSIRDTRKITSAMYMISSSKMKKARKTLADTEPYFYTLQANIARILRHIPELEHRYFDERPQIPSQDRKRGYIVVTADKGMAGAYNHNVMKLAEERAAQGGAKLYVVGEIGRHYFARKNVEVDIQFHYTAQNPTIHRARVIGEKMLELFENGELDEVYIIYTKMENAMKAETEIQQLLPLKKASFTGKKIAVPVEEMNFSPSGEVVMDYIVPNYIFGFLFGALVESYCSEQNSRMMAMEGATDSADEMLRSLSVAYNRARQAAITQEITEVVGGAKAQKRKRRG